VDNNYLDLGMNKSGFVHTLPSGRLTSTCHCRQFGPLPYGLPIGAWTPVGRPLVFVNHPYSNPHPSQMGRV
jgi:hypothetical protein